MRRRGALLLLLGVVLVMVARGEASPTDKEDRGELLPLVLGGGHRRRADAGVVGGGMFCTACVEVGVGWVMMGSR